MSARDLYTKGAKVWIPEPDDVWQGATVTADYRSGVLIVKADKDGSLHQLKVQDDTKLPPLRNPPILLGQNDLTSLSYLHEPAVIHNLRVRFCERNAIYTYCGIVLVAINPYSELPIYGEETIMAYHGRSMGDLDPHIFAVSEEAYVKLEREAKDQSIIVSGESGAGKTVSAKYAMRYFATVGGNANETQIERKVLASNPIMEAIGNAKTTRNDNSSRFGKFIELKFDKMYRISGASMRTYLLEKSRVVYQAVQERNYHIFYQLCDVRSQFPELHLDHPDAFHYLNQGGNHKIDGVDDATTFRETKHALTTLGFTDSEQSDMLKVLAVVLHLGNIVLQDGDPHVVGGREDGAYISDSDVSLGYVCELLGIPRQELTKWLTHKRIASGTEVILSRMPLELAKAARDALAKRIYAQLFAWCVANVNRALHTPTHSLHFIGVLDIYGFETFELNSFEQFCINYANEKLQQQFNSHVFKLEQDEYIKEEIQWTMINFYDNQPCIELIEARLGVLSLLDEECKVPQGSDRAFAGKLRDKCSHYPHFARPRFGDTTFIIKHFADDVEYEAGGFLEKNRDSVSEEQLECVKNSTKCSIMAELCSVDEDATGRVATLPVPQKRRTNIGQHSMTQPVKRTSATTKQTVGAQFRASLAALMATLSATTPHYVRCIKPNDYKLPFHYDAMRAANQLRACGVLETIRISAAGFPSRWTYQDFFNRYRLLCHSSQVDRGDLKKTTKRILSKYIKDPDKYQYGITKIFFRAGQVAYLEKLRADKQRKCCVQIQSCIRGFIARRRYQAIMRAIRGIQAQSRGYLARKRAHELRRVRSAITIQRYLRGWLARRRYQALRRLTVGLQARARGLLVRRRYRNIKRERAAIVVQKYVRGWLARRKNDRMKRCIVICQSAIRRYLARKQYKVLRVEARSLEHVKKLNKGLENKIISLQQRLQSSNEENKQLRPLVSLVEHLKQQAEEYRRSLSEMKHLKEASVEKDSIIQALQTELTKERANSSRLAEEKTALELKYRTERDSWLEEKGAMEIELESVKIEFEKQLAERLMKMDKEMKEVLSELESERTSRQKLMSTQYDLQEQLDKLQRTPNKKDHKRSSSDVSNASQQEGPIEDDYGYGSVRSTDTTRPALEAVNWSAGAQHGTNGPMPIADAGLVLRLQRRLATLQSELSKTSNRAKDLEERLNVRSSLIPASNPTEDRYRVVELEIENNQLRRDLQKLHTTADITKEVSEQLNAMQEELIRRREECVQLRSVLASQTANLKSLTSSNYSGDMDGLHDGGELAQAFEAQKKITRQLESELLSEGKSYKESLEEYKNEIAELREENEKQHKLLSANLSQEPKTAADQFAQNEIVRLSADNLELQERVDKLSESCRRYKSQLKMLADKLKEAGVDGAQQILDSDTIAVRQNGGGATELLPTVRKKEREYLGMFEYQASDENKIVQKLIIDLTPERALELLPCLPAYILFMMLRHTDYIDNEPKMHQLMKSIRTAIRKVVKRSKSVTHVSMWLANMLRLLNNMRQYSGDAIFATHNTPRQNQQCLRLFDLTQYRQVLSDTAVWIYHGLINHLENDLKPLIRHGILDHEEISGILMEKPAAPSSPATAGPRKLTAELTCIYDILQQYNVDADLIIRLFKQLHYFICAESLNQLLLRKDLCCWIKGMQIRYNVSHLEVWVKEKLAPHGSIAVEDVLSVLKPITQAVQLLQARKSMADVQSVVDMVPALTSMQVCKILTVYTPAEEYEVKVNQEFIHAVQKKMQERVGAHSDKEQQILLMDTKLIFAVQFPFTPSDIRLEDIEIPEVLGLAGLLNKL